MLTFWNIIIIMLSSISYSRCRFIIMIYFSLHLFTSWNIKSNFSKFQWLSNKVYLKVTCFEIEKVKIVRFSRDLLLARAEDKGKLKNVNGEIFLNVLPNSEPSPETNANFAKLVVIAKPQLFRVKQFYTRPLRRYFRY